MKRIWIVDDDEEMSHAVGLMLKLLDCEPASFLNARFVAQALLIGKPPDLIILEANMPEVSALELVAYLHRRPESKNIPIVILFSEAADSAANQAFALGADSFIKKPVTIGELEKAMSSAFYKHPNL